MMFHLVQIIEPAFRFEIMEPADHFFRCGMAGRNFGLGYGLFS